MIVWHVKELAQRLGIKTASELAALAGLHKTTVYPIWKGEATRADFNTLSALCRVLQAGTGQVIQYIPDRPDKR